MTLKCQYGKAPLKGAGGGLNAGRMQRPVVPESEKVLPEGMIWEAQKAA